MRKSTASLLLCMLGVPTAYAAPSATPDWPAILAKPAQMFDMTISPDGQHLAARYNLNNRAILVFLDAKTLKTVGSTRLESGNEVGSYKWVNAKRVVFKIMDHEPWEKEPRYYGELFATDIDGRNQELLFGYRAGEQQTGSRLKKKQAKQAWAEFIDARADENNQILIKATPMSDSGERFPEVLQLNVQNGLTKSLGRVPSSFAHVLPDSKGKPRIASGSSSKDETEVWLRDNNHQWQKVPANQYGGTFTPVALSADDRQLYVFDNYQSDHTALFSLDLATGSYKKVLSEAGFDLSVPLRTVDNRAVFGVKSFGTKPTYQLLTSQYPEAQLFKDLLQSFPGEDIVITSKSDDAKKWVVYVHSDVNPGTYYLYDAEQQGLIKLTDEQPALAGLQLQGQQPIEVPTKDGYLLHGYLTTSAKASAEKPMVVLVHGGPHYVRDTWGFDSEVQLLAQSGYNVLQVNYRGSGGYGVKHQQAGYRQWGSLIQQDINTATRWAIDKGHANAGNICIMGGSFGAYSALQAPMLAPDLYRCAIATAGIYDLKLLFDKGDVAVRDTGQAYLQQVLGSDEAELTRYSPVYQAASYQPALLLMHGKNDRRAPYAHAEALRKALDKAGKSYQWHLFDDETHGFYDEQNRALYFRKVQQFLQQHLKV